MADAHGTPKEGSECLCTMEDITMENYCEYQVEPSKKWYPAAFSEDTVRHLLDSQYEKYLSDVEKAAKDCAAAVRRLVVNGPPIYIFDKTAMPLPEGATHISTLWFASDGTEIPAKLKGALEGKERDELWKCQKETLAAMEAAENA